MDPPSKSSMDGQWPIVEPDPPKRRTFLSAVFSHRRSRSADTRDLPPPSYESLYSPDRSKASKYMSRNWLKKYMQQIIGLTSRSMVDSESVFPQLVARRQRRDTMHMFPEGCNLVRTQEEHRWRERERFSQQQDRERKERKRRDRERKYREKERRKRVRRLRFIHQLLQLAKAPPQGLLPTLLSSVLFALLAILALQLVEWSRACILPWPPLIAFPVAYLLLENGNVPSSAQSWTV
ncbi:hypothetical protein C8F04DRAFT_409378 [Mycena alexandri]|uniref:Uncharacterized protein n=1 Tax=Mycena alexandri TaxID=1745969 RepID=A0AAD6T4W9_9AGAR|nr:hypothetical protein C8F04DRAFT_409378 [Mycena alexandri]